MRPRIAVAIAVPACPRDALHMSDGNLTGRELAGVGAGVKKRELAGFDVDAEMVVDANSRFSTPALTPVFQLRHQLLP